MLARDRSLARVSAGGSSCNRLLPRLRQGLTRGRSGSLEGRLHLRIVMSLSLFLSHPVKCCHFYSRWAHAVCVDLHVSQCSWHFQYSHLPRIILTPERFRGQVNNTIAQVLNGVLNMLSVNPFRRQQQSKPTSRAHVILQDLQSLLYRWERCRANDIAQAINHDCGGS